MDFLGPPTLSIDCLRTLYESKSLDPTRLVSWLYPRICSYRDIDPAVWINLEPEEKVLKRAIQLETAYKDRPLPPLYGIPFAVKDNIDVVGVATTAACPVFAYTPSQNATVVDLVLEAGGIYIGKTNLDQFATGLVGERSPYGAPSCVFNKDYISGGSSSGSAVAVAASLVSFAFGTDTAGSGRVPAAFNNIVGFKPTRGIVSAFGVVPACKSLDCVSVFALNCADAKTIWRVLDVLDDKDDFARTDRKSPTLEFPPVSFRFAIPTDEYLQFFGDEDRKNLFHIAITRLEALGGSQVTAGFDYRPFAETATLLYDGPWVAERYAALSRFLEKSSLENEPDPLLPVIRQIINTATRHNAVDAFEAIYKVQAFKRDVRVQFRSSIDLLLVPSVPVHYTHKEIKEDPIRLNSNLGIYTNFVNLLDLCAVAVPTGMTDLKLPVGVTLIAPAFQDEFLLDLGGRLHSMAGIEPGGVLTMVAQMREN